MSIENEKSFEETLKPVNLREKLVEDERMSRAERKFYRSQNALIESYLKSDNGSRKDPSNYTRDDTIRAKIAIYGSMTSSMLLAGLQLYAAISSLSLSFFSTLINTIFDPISNVFLNWVYVRSQKLDKNKWPDGGSRLTSVANCCYSFLMIAVNAILIVESIRSLIEGESSTESNNPSGEINGIHVPSIAAVGFAFLVKIVLCIYCGMTKHLSSQIEILFIDHRNDLPVNGFGILTSAGGTVLKWWIDPAGSILISIGVITVWVLTLVRQFKCLAGITAVERTRKKVLYKAINLDASILQISSCYVYHCGQDVNVRLGIIMDQTTPIYESQQVALSLQNELSEIENVHSVFIEVLASSPNPTPVMLPTISDFSPSELSTIAESDTQSASSRTQDTQDSPLEPAVQLK
ncbi:CDF manganese transporter [Wallemia mellicola]|uniref:CDF manganese transporter n=2 Tax=Wallemia mellicola TaxID=1708541 RepID=A0A4T0SDP0_9BASI|nr:CDF manganese transporter [Wallemia mellicola CBS 633.66]TIB72685.1 hypothetical protein E3Q24_01578 [Wallemia mellicola]EIM20364.1 CDF manganese transporter [Wallemia mellicola CBS 633.66]TIB77890.1 hypothetical protein E3Q23_01061 [Wallemia mellicola]TIB80848.1 CDF manganese transporter [Wallemia mellicola]TIB84747.1 CDF manganese transporter [Wallemia mellicola]|eukprot:XP_006959621.1 CDF manganese transporter [Wallemia mellicola CBS 633.66]